MSPMSRDEWLAFLGHASRTGKLAAVRRDGRPHCMPVWVVLDGDEIVFMTMGDRVKARNMRADPRVVLTVDSEAFPYDFVSVEETATFPSVPAAEMLE